MFYKNGSPAPIDEVISFDLKIATEIRCPKCLSHVGLKDRSMFKPAGDQPKITVHQFNATCPKCGEFFHV